MLRSSLKLNSHELKRLYQHELQEYLLFKRKATLKLLLFAIPPLLISFTLFVLYPTKNQMVPWNIISGITGLYFITRVITDQVDSFSASKRTNADIDIYLAKIERSKSIAYQVSDEAIECFVDDKLESITKWSEVNSVVEKERYFYLISNHGKNILVPQYAVQMDFYKEFLKLAKKSIRYTNAKTVV